MRRGHPGVGGWRNDNPRHFRARGGGSQHFRPPRNYSQGDITRFPPPRLPRPYNPHHNQLDYQAPEHQYRHGHHNMRQRPPRPLIRGQREILPMFQRMRDNENFKQANQHIDNNFHNNSHYSETFRMNSMGDVDHRQHAPLTDHPHFNQRPPTHNNNPPNYYEDVPHTSDYKRRDHSETLIPTIPLYTGHRPVPSDHYERNPSSIDTSDSFSRSVDDTVDIVRKRLLNRSDPQQCPDERPEEPHLEDMREPCTSFQNVQEEPLTKKRTPRQKQNVQLNCDKMKTKIVHQLFKMDKDKIHKLMDNPHSNTKFDYAISSLITESQNSYSRHLRSVAEKSLCTTSSSEFIQNDTNMIYEDTFMKQMQCVLDPQDTILLEDIKPMVLAELSKVLQLDDFDQMYEVTDSQIYDMGQQSNQNEYEYNPHEYDSQETFHNERFSRTSHDDEGGNLDENQRNYDNIKDEYVDQKPLFERRSSSKNSNYERSMSAENRRLSGRSVDSKLGMEALDACESTLPLFETGTQQLSEDEDPFADLDNQYHVAVDHNFIEADDLTDSRPKTPPKPKTPVITKEYDTSVSSNVKTQESFLESLKKEIHSPENRKLGVISPTNAYGRSEGNIDSNIHFNQSYSESIKINHDQERVDSSSMMKSSTQFNSRKRSMDQRPAHRKEKRKKSESSQPLVSKPPVCTPKPSEKPQDHNNIKLKFTLVSSKDENKDTSKDSKKTPTEKTPDKHVKRKEQSKKVTEDGRKRSISTSMESPSPKEIQTNTVSATTSKLDTKIKLKTIDMFLERPKKVTLNRSIPTSDPSPVKAIIEVKPKRVVPPLTMKIVKNVKHAGTQVYKKTLPKETQTISKRNVSRSTQTDTDTTETPKTKSTDAFERMKEIDMEIQSLLQEKFKLYSSLESKESCPNTLPTLGMAVIPLDEAKNPLEMVVTEMQDEIIEDFAIIPAEELEEIAEEVVQTEPEIQGPRRNRRQKILEQETSSKSPSTKRTAAKKAKPPNISLLEKIISDDRPIEDIISLDDLEVTPVKPKKKSAKVPRTKKKNTRKTKSLINLDDYGIKECSVVLVREDFNNPTISLPEQSIPEEEFTVEVEIKNEAPHMLEVVEEVINDLQFDMLDVSEDIIIGDNCEVKTNDKDDSGSGEMMSEEIILDNSQMSCAPGSDAPGQIGTECKTYDYSADENLKRESILVTGNADAVLAIEYVDNKLVAACLDGNVYVFNTEGVLLSTLRGSNLAVTCVAIVHEKYATTVYTGSLDSRIRYYDLDTGLEKGPECNVLSPIQSMDRAWDTVFVGTRTGFVLQFECKNNMLIPVSTVKFSEQSILALRAIKEGPRKVLLVASRSENVTIKDAQTGLLLRTLEAANMTVYTLLYEDGKVYCGTSTHLIQVFDYASGSHVGWHAGGKGAVCLRASGGLLFAGCYDGCVYVFREGGRAPLAQLRGPGLMLLSLAIVGHKIIAGYKDRSLYIWKIPESILNEMVL